MREYEILMMFPATLKPDEVVKVAQRLLDAAAPKGLEVSSLERWPKRRFAYEVKHHTEGFYCEAAFRASPEALRELDRLCRLDDSVLRHKIVSVARRSKSASGRVAGSLTATGDTTGPDATEGAGEAARAEDASSPPRDAAESTEAAE